MARKGKDPNELRQTIINAAQEIIRDEGMNKCNVRAITKKAKCALGSLSYLFNGVEDVILAVNARTLSDMGEYMFQQTSLVETQSTKERLTVLALAYFQYAKDHSNEWNALFALHFSDKSLPPEYLATRDGLIVKITTLFSEKMQQDESALTLARTMYEAVHGIVILGLDHRLGGYHQDVEQRLRLLVSLMIHES